MKDLTINNITDNVHAINSSCEDAHLRFLFERLVSYLHDLTQQTKLSIAEWEAAIKFLVDVGEISTKVCHEFILLSDILRLSLLINCIGHPKPPGTTKGTILAPFHTEDAVLIQPGDTISHDADGEPLFTISCIRDTSGNPIPHVLVDVRLIDTAPGILWRYLGAQEYTGAQAPLDRAVLINWPESPVYLKVVPATCFFPLLSLRISIDQNIGRSCVPGLAATLSVLQVADT